MAVLTNWRVFETREGTLHFVGFKDSGQRGRVSSPIVRFDPQDRVGVTESGRVYRLAGSPCEDESAAALFAAWAIGHEIEGGTDVTERLLAGPAYQAGFSH